MMNTISKDESPFWLHYGEYIKRFSYQIQELDPFPERTVGLARKYHRLVDLAETYGIYLPDAPTEWSCGFEQERYANKSVLFLDDIVIRGTMLSRSISHFNKAHRIPPKSIDIACLVVNKDTILEGIPVKIFGIQANNTNSNMFCSEIVQAIQSLGKPYDLDHPEIELIIPSEINELIDKLGVLGEIVSTTTASSHDYGVSMWTLLPSQEFIKDFLMRYQGEALNSYILKVRLFFKHQTRKLIICPIIVSYCQNDSIGAAWNFNDKYKEIINQLASSDSCNTPLAIFRLGTYFLEFILGHRIVHHISQLFQISPKLDARDTCRIFGDLYGHMIMESLNPDLVNGIHENERVIQNLNLTGPVPWEDNTIVGIRERIQNHTPTRTSFLARPNIVGKMAVIYRRLHDILESNADIAINEGKSPAEVADRLLLGFTPIELENLMQELNDGVKIDFSMMSLGIDIADTNGIIVPKTLNMGNTVGRYLAYGEDTSDCCDTLLKEYLARALLIDMPRIYPFQSQISFDSIEFEKILVFAFDELFQPEAIKIGSPMATALCCDYNCQHDKGKIKLEAAIHGHYLGTDFEDTPRILTDWLHKEKIIKHERFEERIVPNFEYDNYDKDLKLNDKIVLNIAQRMMIADYLQKSATKIRADDIAIRQYPVLVALTSCASERRFAWAIRAALDSFYRETSTFSPYHKQKENNETFWQLFEKICKESWFLNGDNLSILMEKMESIDQSSVEMFYKIKIFEKREIIATQIEDLFKNERGIIWENFANHVQPILKKLKQICSYTKDEKYFLDNLIWLSQITLYLTHYLNMIIELYYHTNKNNIELIDRKKEMLPNLVKTLLDLSKTEIIMEPQEKMVSLKRIIQSLEPAHPNNFDVQSLNIIKTKVESAFNDLRTIYYTNYEPRYEFLSALDTIFPLTITTPSYRISCDLRKSSPLSAKSPSLVDHNIDEKLKLFKAALTDLNASCERDKGDSISIIGSDLKVFLNTVNCVVGQTRIGKYLRLIIVHDNDAYGLIPPIDKNKYNIASRFSTEIDNFVRTFYEGKEGTIIGISNSVIKNIGDSTIIETLIHKELTRETIMIKSESHPRIFWHALLQN